MLLVASDVPVDSETSAMISSILRFENLPAKLSNAMIFINLEDFPAKFSKMLIEIKFAYVCSYV